MPVEKIHVSRLPAFPVVLSRSAEGQQRQQGRRVHRRQRVRGEQMQFLVASGEAPGHAQEVHGDRSGRNFGPQQFQSK